MAQEDWQLVSALAQGLGSILSVVITAWIAVMVRRYTKRKDHLDFLNHKWSIQQQINLDTLGRCDLALDFERMVYGDSAPVSEADASRNIALFLQINLIQSDWFAYREKMISLEEFNSYTLSKLNMLVRQRPLIEYLLEHRGYHRDFADHVKTLIKEARPLPAFPAAAVDPAKSEYAERAPTV
jgi:hypothetical protein